MTCNSQCCGIAKIFDDKGAQKRLKAYRKKGPESESRKLIEAVKEQGIEAYDLLDIGGGIGVVQYELMEAGVTRATDVDASPAYVQLAKELSKERGVSDRITYVEGDFTQVGREVPQHDIVTLDKVVCCYNHMPEIVSLSVSKAKKYYGLVYPKENILSRAAKRLANFMLWIKGSDFRSFVHPVKEIQAIIKSEGFEQVKFDTTLIWRIELYERKN